METEVEERSISIVFNLLQNQGPKGGRRERVAAKFVEAEFEKCDRLMELYFRCGGGRRDGEAGNGEVRGGTVLQVAGEESEGSMLIAPPTFCPLDPPLLLCTRICVCVQLIAAPPVRICPLSVCVQLMGSPPVRKSASQVGGASC